MVRLSFRQLHYFLLNKTFEFFESSAIIFLISQWALSRSHCKNLSSEFLILQSQVRNQISKIFVFPFSILQLPQKSRHFATLIMIFRTILNGSRLHLLII